MSTGMSASSEDSRANTREDPKARVPAGRPTEVDVTWVGHASVIVDTGGYRLITDPLLTRRVAHLRRRRPPPAPSCAHVDLALLSHAHMDHIHVPSLRRLPRTASVVTTAGTTSLLKKIGFADVTEVVAGDEVSPTEDVSVRATFALHTDGRGPHSNVKAPPIGFLIDAAGQRVYFAGDTDLFDGMAELGPIDAALLPVWGWGPTIGTGHLDPVRAAEATALLQPRRVIPIHWGTFAPEDGRRRIPPWFERPVVEFRDELDKLGLLDRLELLEPGETVRLTET